MSLIVVFAPSIWIALPAIAVLGIGIGWAGMMGNTYVMLADCIPPQRNGIYMGIFNLFIVIPMLIQTLTMPLIYRPLLGGDPRHVLMLGGVLMLAGALATLLVDAGRIVASVSFACDGAGRATGIFIMRNPLGRPLCAHLVPMVGAFRPMWSEE